MFPHVNHDVNLDFLPVLLMDITVPQCNTECKHRALTLRSRNVFFFEFIRHKPSAKNINFKQRVVLCSRFPSVVPGQVEAKDTNNGDRLWTLVELQEHLKGPNMFPKKVFKVWCFVINVIFNHECLISEHLSV